MKKDVRRDFPFLHHDSKRIYLDNAATTQKPQQVIDAVSDFYAREYATIHRGIYEAGEQATRLYDEARKRVASFIGATSEELVFTKGATEGINFIASTWGVTHIGEGDEILLTQMEHHANIVPWLKLASQKKAVVKYIPITPDGELDLSQLPTLLTPKTKIVGITHQSNVLGTTNPVEQIIAAAHESGALVLVDAAQSVPHMPVDVARLNADFMVFSGHKMLGPTGIGALYIKKELYSQVPPYQYGGGMVKELNFEEATFVKPPERYEAGTPPIAQAIGLAAAVDYLEAIGMKSIQEHEVSLCAHLLDGLKAIPQITVYGPVDQLRTSGHLVSFEIKDLHAHDVAAFLDKHKISMRAGHFCAQPLIEVLGTNSLIRVSIYLYNTLEEINYLLDVLNSLCKK